MKVISWNVNGIRAATRNGFLDWLHSETPDLVCIQESKANADQLDSDLLQPQGYNTYWHSAEKAGYSGVALFSKKKPKDIVQGIKVPEIDSEGRVISAFFDSLVVVNAYFPNSQREKARLDYKLFFCDEILKYLEKLRRSHSVLLCGDYNIAHKEIDLKNPKTNVNNAGFLPEERAWMDHFIKKGWVDSFRHFHPELKDQYSWWSYRPGVREKNIGWRIDYHCVNQEMAPKVKAAWIDSHVTGSDHCPVGIEIS
jgi:exodeoxyribonuclease-3